MQARGEITPIVGLKGIYEVTVPYADKSPISEHEILMEVHPYAALGYISALEFHQLTNDRPNTLVALIPREQAIANRPPDTSVDDWIGMELVSGRRIGSILNQPIQWITVAPDRYFGIDEYQPFGYTVRATNPERTLIDGLMRPEISGGIESVLIAWGIAHDTIDVDLLIHYIERLEINVLRQRVGFILETLDIQHPALETWSQQASRGGSSKLLASAPYSELHSERWSLSLNAPIDVLHDHAAP